MRKSGNLKALSVAIPVVSILLIISAYLWLEPRTTGLVVQDTANIPQMIDADVSVSTKENEVLPPETLVEISLDGKKSSIVLADFILLSGQMYEMDWGEMDSIGWKGNGFTGNHKYTVSLSDFAIERNVGPGQHIFKTRLVYRDTLLYEKESRIMIGGVENARIGQ